MAMRRPSGMGGAALLRKVRAELQTGWPPGLTLLTGDDLYHLDRAQRALLEALAGEDESAFGRTQFGDEPFDVATAVAAARSAGMFAPRRVVLVSDIAVLEGEPEVLKDYATSPPPQSYLLVRAPVLDQRRKLHKALATAGRTLRFQAAAPGETGRHVADLRAMAGERGLDLDSESAMLLVEATAGNLYRLAGELDKLRAWIGGDGGKVTPQAVREVAASGGLLSGWELADALVVRDRTAGLAAARRLVDAGEEPIKIVGGLAWRARVMLQGKALMAAGKSADQAASAVRVGDSLREALATGLRRYSLEEVLGFPSLLLAADRTLKSRSIHPRAVLENLVDALIGRPTAGGGGRR